MGCRMRDADFWERIGSSTGSETRRSCRARRGIISLVWYVYSTRLVWDAFPRKKLISTWTFILMYGTDV